MVLKEFKEPQVLKVLKVIKVIKDTMGHKVIQVLKEI